MTDTDRQWVRELVREYVDAVVTVIGAEVGKCDTEVAKVLRKEIGELRAEIEVLRAHKPSKPTEGSITSLRGRHVA